jgi:PAP_fibrillin
MVLMQTIPVNDDPALRESQGLKPPFLSPEEPVMASKVRTVSDLTEETAAEYDDEQKTVAAAKAQLKAMLVKHGRSASHPEVVQAMEELVALNTTKDAVLSPYLEGSYVSLTRAEFPGRLKQEPGNEHLDQYTLGRMSFGIFQPANLVCSVCSTHNELRRVPKDGKGENQDGEESRTYAYPLVTNVIIHTPKGDFPASLHMEAFCMTDKQPKNRMGVTFVGGTLVPGEDVRSNPSRLSLWKEVFAKAYEKAKAERSYLSSLMLYVFQWMFQLTTPTDEDAQASESCSFRFEMKRCPHGYIDVLYLDEDMRITRGNRGTVVILERAPGKET